MGSSMSAIRDREEEKQWEEDKNWLKEKAKEVERVNPASSEFRDLQWLEKNKEKILRNRNLIDLIG